jgi:hypothetical protein
MNKRPVEAAVLRRQSHPIITNLALSGSLPGNYRIAIWYSYRMTQRRCPQQTLSGEGFLDTDFSVTQIPRLMWVSVHGAFYVIIQETHFRLRELRKNYSACVCPSEFQQKLSWC